MSECFELKEYAPNKTIAKNVIKNTNLIANFDEQYGSDLVRGRYKGVSFEFSDIELMEKIEYEDDEGNIRVSHKQRFKGQWIILETAKRMKSSI